MKVAIVQKEIPPYRIPFFNGLSDQLQSELTLFTAKHNRELRCRQEVITLRKIGKFIFSKELLKFRWDEFDIIVMMFDVRWLLLYQLLFCQRRKLVLWGHGMGTKQNLWLFKRWLILWSSGLITYEEKGSEFFKVKGVPDRKLAYTGNTVEIQDYALSKKPRDSFIYVGRLQPRKDLYQIIKAFALLPEQLRSKCNIVFLGDGEIKANLVKIAEALGVYHLCQFVPGTYDKSIVKKYFDNAIAYVSPGHVGLGILHAFAYGVPVITRKRALHAPEVGNVSDQVNGYLVDDSDQAVMEAMKSYLIHNDIHRRHCAAAFKRYAEQRTMPQMINRFIEALSKFVAC
jgi:glycosyltransferase involved in cell wall biosynthesis